MFQVFPFLQLYPPKYRKDLEARNLRKKPAFSSLRRPAIHYTYLMRMAEYFGSKHTTVHRFLGRYYQFATRRYGLRYGMLIPPKVAPGPGLFIVHAGGIVVNGGAQIGRNCRIHAGVNIGQSEGGVPQIGDNVYLGPGAKLFGGITIGDNAQIGANAVVSRSVPPNSVVSGPYAQVISRVRNVGTESALKPLPAPDGGPRAEDDLDSTVDEMVMRVLKREIHGLIAEMMGQTFDEAGIDSFALISLRSAIETESNRKISDDGWSQIQSLSGIRQLASLELRQEATALDTFADFKPADASNNISHSLPIGKATKRYSIGMPQMAVSGLSESWLFKETGDIHWNMLAAFLGRKSNEICDDAGNRLYATFARVRIKIDGTLRDFCESQNMEIEGKLSRFGANLFFSEQTLIAPDARAEIQTMSSFAMHMAAKDNTALRRGSPLIGNPEALPSLSQLPGFAEEYKAERNRNDDRHLFKTTYEILPPHDINGVGLLYFAAYPSIFDICIEQHEGRGFLGSTSVSFRDISYIANARPDDELSMVLHQRSEEQGVIRHFGSIFRTRDKQRMAAIESHRRRVS